MKVYQAIARKLQAWQNCSPDNPWKEEHRERLQGLMREHCPSGAGWDLATSIDLEKSTPDKLVLVGSFHHMNENGMYDGWTDHEIWVRPSLAYDFTVTVKGRDRDDIKEYLGEMFYDALTEEVRDA